MDKEVESYLESLNEKEKIAYNIAKDFLKTSFNIHKSLGFIQWKKLNNQQSQTIKITNTQI